MEKYSKEKTECKKKCKYFNQPIIDIQDFKKTCTNLIIFEGKEFPICRIKFKYINKFDKFDESDGYVPQYLRLKFTNIDKFKLNNCKRHCNCPKSCICFNMYLKILFKEIDNVYNDDNKNKYENINEYYLL